MPRLPKIPQLEVNKKLAYNYDPNATPSKIKPCKYIQLLLFIILEPEEEAKELEFDNQDFPNNINFDEELEKTALK